MNSTEKNGKIEMNNKANASKTTAWPRHRAGVRIAAATAMAALAVSSVISCKRQFSPVGRLRDSTYTHTSPVSVQISIGTTGWLVTIGGGAGPEWNATVTSVSLVAPVSGQEVNPFVGPGQLNSTTPFEFVPAGAQYRGRFQLASIDGKRSANCTTESGGALNTEIPAASVKCDKDLNTPAEPNRQPQDGQDTGQNWDTKIAAQVMKGSGGAQAISSAISFMGGEQIPVDVRDAWYKLEKDVNAIAERYNGGGNPYDEVLTKVNQSVTVDKAAELAQKLLDGRNGGSGGQGSGGNGDGQSAQKCTCQVSKCTKQSCETPVAQVLSNIRTESECTAKSNTSEDSFPENTKLQYTSCSFK